MLSHPLRVLGRLIHFFVVLIAALTDFLWSVKRHESGVNYTLRARWSHRWGKAFLNVLHIRVESRGSAPERGLIACNHLGYLDIVVLGALEPFIFVSKAEVRRWPAIGWLASCAGTLFIQRERKTDVKTVADQFAEVMRQDAVLTLFPEGTSSDGHAVLPFRSSLFEPAVQNGWPVSGARISYELGSGSVEDEVCYWRDMTFLPHFLNILSKDAIRACVVFGEPVPAGLDRKEMAETLWRQVSQLEQISTARTDS